MKALISTVICVMAGLGVPLLVLWRWSKENPPPPSPKKWSSAR